MENPNSLTATDSLGQNQEKALWNFLLGMQDSFP